MEKQYIVINGSKRFEKFAKILFILAFLLLCIYVSRDNIIWSIISGGLFLIISKKALNNNDELNFNSMDELKQYLNKEAA